MAYALFFRLFILPVSCRLSLQIAVATLSANILYYLGIGQHRSVIILGALMILIPGAYFVNAIREFTQNNYYSGLAVVRVLHLSSISVGVLLLDFHHSPLPGTVIRHILNTVNLMAGVLIQTFIWDGTTAFSVLYRVPEILLGPRNPRSRRYMAPLPRDLE